MSRALAVCHGSFGRATVYELDRPLVTHAHREGHLVHQFGGYPGRVMVRNTPVTCRPDQIVTINPWEPHAYTPGSLVSPGLVFVMYIRPQWLAGITGSDVAADSLFSRPNTAVTPALSAMLARVVAMIDDPPRDGSLDRLLAEICMACAEAEARAPVATAPRRPWTGLDFRVRRSIDALSDPAGAMQPMEQVALSCGLSRAHFFKLFAEQTGVTPVIYANTIRIEKSLQRIAMPRASISGIGDELGFSCQSAFTRFFVSHIGMAPTAYRAAIRMLGEAEAA